MRRLLANREFRRLFLGRLVTNAGDSVYSVASMWLVYQLTSSSFFTGLAGFLTLGMQALQAFVGPLVDRWPLRRMPAATAVERHPAPWRPADAADGVVGADGDDASAGGAEDAAPPANAD